LLAAVVADDQLEEDLKPRLGDKLLVKNIKDATHGFAVGNSNMTAQEKQWKEEAYVRCSFGAGS
jgi:hypothetical protein